MAGTRRTLQVALNGASSHPTTSRDPQPMAFDAAASVAAGATVIRLHAFDESGRETLAAGPVGRAITAVRAACPLVPISFTAFSNIDPYPKSRYAAGPASWAVNRRAAALGHGIRTGVEDTLLLPAGRYASGNDEVVTAAATMLRA